MNCIHYHLGEETACPFPDFNGSAMEAREWLPEIPSYALEMMWLPFHGGVNLSHVSERAVSI